MKQYRCVPIAIGLPLIFIAGLVAWLLIFFDTYSENDVGGWVLCIMMSLLALGLAARRCAGFEKQGRII